MRRPFHIFFIFIFLNLLVLSAFSKHIKGGEIHYTYLGPSTTIPGGDRYEIRLRLFISCQSSMGQIESAVTLGIFQSSSNRLVSNVSAALSKSYTISLTKPNPCIINPTPVCYWVREFTVVVDLPKDPAGYMVVYQRCCRIDGIRNIYPNVEVGASYFCQIQGTNSIGANGINSNPDFGIKDTVLICQRKKFRLDYSATDADGDSLTYEFASGYYGGDTSNPVVTNPTPPSSWVALRYGTGFSGTQPLGRNVTINKFTGMISGVAPFAGDYVVCVLIKEFRGGILVSSHRKDFIIHVDDRCDFPTADLDPSYITCNGFDFTFQNEASTSPLIHSYYWDFGVAGSITDTSTQAKPTFSFPDTGVYTVKFYVNKDENCTDSASTQMSVFPGFFPGFTSQGTCILNAVTFTDTTKTKYGKVFSWYWDFGDSTTLADTARNSPNSSWKYSDTGMKNVSLIVGNSKGCLDTVYQTVHMTLKPPIFFPFRDTLICNIDTLQLHAEGFGNFTWTPAANMINPNTPDPLVYPKTTTYYTATLDQSGCINSDSLRVRVVDHVTLNAGNDSTICLGDTIVFHPTGDALYFSWSPAATLNDPLLKNPNAFPDMTTTYSVVGSIGKCFTDGNFTIRTVPYPMSNAGADTFICYLDTAQIEATAKGIRYSWVPAMDLSNSTILNPKAYPLQTTTYNLLVYDTVGCPKPGISKVVIEVNPQIMAFAGNDTSVVVGQPLHLQGSGAPSYVWNPSMGLDRNDISTPTAVLSQNQTYIMKAYNEAGCFAYDTINVKVFTTQPDIFVPNAFTPTSSTNNIFRPIAVGISKIEFFRVYNRNGMLVFNTSQLGKGWDGTVNGKPQDTGAFVWMVQGTDYTGKTVSKNGSMVLIR